MNLIGIFDRVYVHPDIKKSPPFILYARTAETFEDNLWVRVFDPDDQPQVEIKCDPPKIEIPEGRDPTLPKQLQFAIPVQLTFHKQGTFWFDVAYRDFSLGGAGLVVGFRKIGEDERGTDTYI